MKTGVKKKPVNAAPEETAGSEEAPGLREIRGKYRELPELEDGLHTSDAGRTLAQMGPLGPHALKTGEARSALHDKDGFTEGKGVKEKKN